MPDQIKPSEPHTMIEINCVFTDYEASYKSKIWIDLVIVILYVVIVYMSLILDSGTLPLKEAWTYN